MANPQRENGHIDIANEIVEALSRIRISGEEMQVLWVIFRKTYGWQKRSDAISLSQFALMTGLKKPHIIRALNKLIDKNIITKKDNDIANIFNFNKDFDVWKPLPKKITLPLLVTSVTKKDNASLPLLVPTITTNTKDTITKDKDIISEVIIYLNQVSGKNYKTTTPTTRKMISTRLNEGFTIENFKTVIDRKTRQWRNDKEMSKFLRPETLFGTKFESYLNEQDPPIPPDPDTCRICKKHTSEGIGMITPDELGMICRPCKKNEEKKNETTVPAQ